MRKVKSMSDWRVEYEGKKVGPEKVLAGIDPGMNIFIGTGVAEPRTLVKSLMNSNSPNLQDLTLLQIVSFGDALSERELHQATFRLKTFYSGWMVSDLITKGRVDLIPSRFSRIPSHFKQRRIPIDVAFVQVTPPDKNGYCSLGAAADVSKSAMQVADLVVGEVSPEAPFTFGDSLVHIREFDFFIDSTEPLFYFDRWPVEEVFDKLAANISMMVRSGDCLAFSIGPVFEALAKHLSSKRDLGVHSPFFTDPLMDLVCSGAVTNRFKETFRGKSVATYVLGSRKLMEWIDRNPLVEMQAIDKVCSPLEIGRIRNFVTILPASKVDLTGRLALHFGKGNVAAGPSETVDFVNGAELSNGGKTIAALTSRNRQGQPNVRLTVDDLPNQFTLNASVDMVVTEYGVAHMMGRTVRERAQALIDIAHPDDRRTLVEEGKAARILYPDQIFLDQSASCYPSEIHTRHTFGNDVEVLFRPIRPSDEDAMRRLFYSFSDEAIYYRYFSPIATMPHRQMQKYVNVDYNQTMAIVGIYEDEIIAEARYARISNQPSADVAFVVDERYSGMGIGTFMYKMLIELAMERGLTSFTAEVLSSNKQMLRVFEKGGIPVASCLSSGVYSITIPLKG